MSVPVRYLLLLAVVLTVTSCGAPPYLQQVDAYKRAGQCDQARRAVDGGTTDTERIALLYGALYLDCDHDRAAGVRWLTLAARYGNPVAIQQLTKMNERVPSADLKNRSVSCSTYRDALGVVRSNCSE